jgi:hypothetical protein
VHENPRGPQQAEIRVFTATFGSENSRINHGGFIGFVALFAGIVIMVAALDAGAGPQIVTWPMLLAGLGVGALASQLGGVTVSSLPDEQSGEVGGIQR